jgi:hypothetical protein
MTAMISHRLGPFYYYDVVIRNFIKCAVGINAN